MTYALDFPTKIFRLFMFFSLLLLAFSTTKEQGGVITFSAPFLGLTILTLLPFALPNLLRIDGYVFILSLSYITVMAVATLLSADVIQSFVRFFFYLVAVVLFWSLLAVKDRFSIDIQYLSKLIQIAGISVSLYFISNFIYQSIEHGLVNVIYERHVGGLMSLPWAASNVIAQVLLLCLFSCLFVESKSGFSNFCVFIFFLAIVLTLSRSVLLLSLPIVLIYFGFVRFSIAFSILAALITYWMTVYAADLIDLTGFYDFIERRTNANELLSGNDRFDLSLTKIEYFLQHPFEPVGFYSSISQFQSTAHNYWITTLVEQSLFALLVSILLFSLFFVRACLLGFKIGFGFFMVMMGLSVEDPQFTQQYTILIWLVFLMIQVSYEKKINRRENSN